jgi:hypothetical protein
MISKAQQHEIKAKNFIDGVIEKSKLSYNALMVNLKNKKEDWESESFKLSFINLFDMTSEEYNRKNYLNALINYAERLLFKHKYNPTKKEQIVISGNNLSVSTR